MKILVLSDIHGNSEALKKVFVNTINEEIEQILILGDTYSSYYSKSVDDNEINKILNQFKCDVIMLKGNCDGPLAYDESPYGLRDIYSFYLKDKICFAYHGHLDYSYLTDVDVFLSGHTHRFMIRKNDNKWYLNPGSVGRPRDYSIGSYLILSDNYVTIFDLNNQILAEEKL